MIHLVRDVLDSQLLARRGLKMGKVDGIVLELREGAAPRVAAIETGLVPLSRRLGPGLARRVERLIVDRGLPVNPDLRIPWAQVRREGIEIRVGIDAETSPAYVCERWLRDRVIGRIPGA